MQIPKPRKRPVTEEKRFALNVGFWKICVHRSGCVNEQHPLPMRGLNARKIALLAGLITEKDIPNPPAAREYPRDTPGIRTLTVAEWIEEVQAKRLENW